MPDHRCSIASGKPDHDVGGIVDGGFDAVDYEDYLPVPAWLNAEFLAHAYGENLGMAVRIVRFNVVPATAKGENYASAMYRVTLAYAPLTAAEVCSD